MPRLIAIAPLFVVLLSGCGGSPSVDDQPSLTEQMVETMKTIKDADSAKSAAPKLEALAEKIHVLQEEALSAKGAAPSDPEKFAERQMAALEAYGAELTRISNIPGAPQQLQNMIKKMTPDGEMVAAFNSRVEAALGDIKPDELKLPPPVNEAALDRAGGINSSKHAQETRPEAKPIAATTPAAAAPAAEKVDLRPDPNFSGQIIESSVPEELSKWFPTAKKGDFVEFEAVHDDGRGGVLIGRDRHEVLEIDGEWALIASVHQLAAHRDENRVRMKVAADKPWPPAPAWPPKPLGDQTIAAAGRQFHCQGVKHGGVTSWYCDEVPYNRVVKEEQHGVPKTLVAFGRGSGPSPAVPAAVVARATAPPRQSQEMRPASPAPASANDPNVAQKIEELQASAENLRAEIERANKELNKAEADAEGLEKKLKRLAIASAKSKRGKDAKSEFQRELKDARSAISNLKREIKKYEEQLGKTEKELKTYQAKMEDRP